MELDRNHLQDNAKKKKKQFIAFNLVSPAKSSSCIGCFCIFSLHWKKNVPKSNIFSNLLFVAFFWSISIADGSNDVFFTSVFPAFFMFKHLIRGSITVESVPWFYVNLIAGVVLPLSLFKVRFNTSFQNSYFSRCILVMDCYAHNIKRVLYNTF